MAHSPNMIRTLCHNYWKVIVCLKLEQHKKKLDLYSFRFEIKIVIKKKNCIR